MLPRIRLPHGAAFVSAVAVVLLIAAPAEAACNDRTASLFDWNRCWSLSRGLTALAVLLASFLVCFLVLFPVFLMRGHNDLDRSGRSTARWPRTAFGLSLALFWLVSWLTFLFFFAVLSDELHRPGSSNWLEGNWPWLGACLVAIGGAALITAVVRHPQPSRAK